MTNGQLSLQNSVTTLAGTVTKLINDIEAQRESDLKAYSRLAQAPAFQHLRMNITNFALTKIALEWDDLTRLMATTATPETLELGDYSYLILL